MSEWISVKDELPELNKYVLLVYFAYAYNEEDRRWSVGTGYVAWKDEEGRPIWEFEDTRSLPPVSYWKELPSLPKDLPNV